MINKVFRAERFFQESRSNRETRLTGLLTDLEENEKLIERMMSLENQVILLETIVREEKMPRESSLTI